MIPFFIKIRKQLALDNKPLKYLRYAIGEIVLVVIGILIALQINNWNSERILQNKKNSYLFDIVSDLKVDTVAFSRGLIYYQDLIASKESDMLKTSYKDSPTDSLENLITPRFFANRISDLTFQKTKNSGITTLSKNEYLSEKIYNYYVITLRWHNVIFDWEEEYSYKEGDFWYYKQDIYEVGNTINLPVLKNLEENRKSLIKLITSPQGRNYLTREIERKKRILQHLEDIKKSATDLIGEIQAELDKSKA